MVPGSSLDWALWESEIKKTLSLLSRHLLSSEKATHGQKMMEQDINFSSSTMTMSVLNIPGEKVGLRFGKGLEKASGNSDMELGLF